MNYNFTEILNDLVADDKKFMSKFNDWPLINFYTALQSEMHHNRHFTSVCISKSTKSILREEYSTIHEIYMYVDKELTRRGIQC